MKHTLAIAVTLVMVAGSASAAVLAEDHFMYPDGSLVPNGGWANHSGVLGTLLVASGVAVVEHGIPDEDANLAFTPTVGTLYYGCTFSVDDLGAPYVGTDNEYFISLRLGFSLPARVDISPPSGGGDFTVGIASTAGVADSTWPTDLTYGTTYTVVVKYDQVTDQAELWIDPLLETDPSILGADEADPGTDVDSIALRQSDSSENETVRVDDVVVATTFAEIVANVPVELQSFAIE